ncbi:MAG TPA: Do family serine endopeptidase, partial [Burkholderiaceae bacterium]|nr:Do family serine endopeptidase [Burkholderiaceae bacterium]
RRVPDKNAIDGEEPLLDLLRRLGLPIARGPAYGIGSGFIVRPDGVILTNAHVVAGATAIAVRLTDEREFAAAVVGVDRASDVAVLKVEADNLPTVSVGDPAATSVGDWVLAIGSPFGFDNSVTAGIVSAKSRALGDDSFVSFIQTDVAINPGNSGGPLFNLNGEVIGINAQIVSRAGGFEGVSFAIPIDMALRVSQQLLAHGRVYRGRLGVSIQELTPALAGAFGLAGVRGALVTDVEPGSAALRAGLRVGDVIAGLNGARLNHSYELPARIAQLAPNARVGLDVWRERRPMRIEAALSIEDQSAEPPPGIEHVAARLGLSVRPLTEQERAERRLAGGLVVEEATGAAALAGIGPGDLVLAVNGRLIRAVEELREAVARADQDLALLMQHDDARQYVPVRLQ